MTKDSVQLVLTCVEDDRDPSHLGAYVGIGIGPGVPAEDAFLGVADLLNDAFAKVQAGRQLVPVLVVFGIDHTEPDRLVAAVAAGDRLAERHPEVLAAANNATQLIYFVDRFGVPFTLHLCPTRTWLGPDKSFTPDRAIRDVRHLRFYPGKREGENPVGRLQAAAVDPRVIESLRLQLLPGEPDVPTQVAETREAGQLVARFGRYLSVDGSRVVRHGSYVGYRPTGGVKTQVTYRHGTEEGLGRDYHENGVLGAEGHYQAGQRHGVWRYWGSDGNEEPPAEFVAGVEVVA